MSNKNLARHHQKLSEVVVFMGSLAIEFYFIDKSELEQFTRWLINQTIESVLTNSFEDVFHKWSHEEQSHLYKGDK